MEINGVIIIMMNIYNLYVNAHAVSEVLAISK